MNLHNKKVDKFYNWMLKINSIHFCDNQAMTKAYDKITNEKI
tara:strand:- start:589 stop:714 length:126 start_codon:yes stop_codon:yes gene_type:complete